MTRDPCGKMLGLFPRNSSIINDSATNSLIPMRIIPGYLPRIILKERHNSLTRNSYAPSARINLQLAKKKQEKKCSRSLQMRLGILGAALYSLGKIS